MKSQSNLLIKKLISFQIIYNLFIKFFISDFGIPSLFNYLTDIINIIIFIYAIFYYRSQKKENYSKIKFYGSFIFPVLFLVVGTVSFLMNYSNILLYIWALRNTFRFYLFFWSCIIVLEKKDLKHIFNNLEKIYIINVFICIYEYFVKGIKYDSLGGIFGNNVIGGNGPLNAFLIFMMTYAVIQYFYKEKKISYVLFVLISSLSIASIAELKIVFIEFIILFILLLLILKKNIKMIFITVFILIIGYFGVQLYSSFYPERANFLSVEYFLNYGKNTTYGDKSVINRFSAFEYINNNYFYKDNEKKMLGIGLGNAEMSQFKDLTSDFYRENGILLKYNWFSHVFMYIEIGYVGIIIYLLFFIQNIYNGNKFKKDIKNYNYINLSIILNVFCIIFFFYNQTLRLETTTYLIFFILSIPYILKNDKERMIL